MISNFCKAILEQLEIEDPYRDREAEKTKAEREAQEATLTEEERTARREAAEAETKKHNDKIKRLAATIFAQNLPKPQKVLTPQEQADNKAKGEKYITEAMRRNGIIQA